MVAMMVVQCFARLQTLKRGSLPAPAPVLSAALSESRPKH